MELQKLVGNLLQLDLTTAINVINRMKLDDNFMYKHVVYEFYLIFKGHEENGTNTPEIILNTLKCWACGENLGVCPYPDEGICQELKPIDPGVYERGTESGIMDEEGNMEFCKSVIDNY